MSYILQDVTSLSAIDLRKLLDDRLLTLVKRIKLPDNKCIEQCMIIGFV